MLSFSRGLFAALVASAASGSAGGARPRVTTSHGVLEGVVQDGASVYHDIPFAAPPTEQYRWKLPRAPPSWDGVRDAQSVEKMCPQFDFVKWEHFGSEDCKCEGTGGCKPWTFSLRMCMLV